ncbi:MAG: ribose-phosphate diphosphokinase [Pirellulaceae bacterium]
MSFSISNLSECTLSTFPDGEFHCKIEDVRGRDVFLIQPTSPPVNDHLMELLIMIDTCKRASAARVTTVIPYFGYARQDRKDEGRVPITAKLVANLIARAGADRVLAMDLHAPQIQGFFDVPVDHLYAGKVLTKHFKSQNWSPNDLVVVSPDEGSIKRAVGHMKRWADRSRSSTKRRESIARDQAREHHRRTGRGKIASMFKRHDQHSRRFAGAAELVKRWHGAKEIHVAVTHGVFAGKAIERLQKSPIDSVVITDSIPLRPEHRPRQNQGSARGAPLGRGDQADPSRPIDQRDLRRSRIEPVRVASAVMARLPVCARGLPFPAVR